MAGPPPSGDIIPRSCSFFFWKRLRSTNGYTPVIKHSNGISPFLIGNTSSKGPFSIAMLDCRSVIVGLGRLVVWIPGIPENERDWDSWGPCPDSNPKPLNAPNQQAKPLVDSKLVGWFLLP